MRYPCPFVLYQIVVSKGRSEVFRVESVICVTQPSGCQSAVFCHFPVGHVFEFREHRLSEYGAAEIFYVFRQQILSICQILFVCDEILHQEVLIDGRSDLCSEYRVASVYEGLVLSGI